MNWQQMEALFVQDLRDSGCSKDTIRTYFPWIMRFMAFCAEQEIAAPAAFKREHFDAWQARLTLHPGTKGTLYSVRTVDTALRGVRAMFACAMRHQKLLVNPLADVQLPSIKKPTKTATATQADIERLLAVPDGATPIGLRDRAVLETLYGTGIRCKECHSIDLRDLDLPGRTLRVRGKGGVERVAPIGDALAATLEEYLAMSRPRLIAMGQKWKWKTPHALADPAEPSLFLSTAGTRHSTQSIEKLLQSVRKKAGLEDLTPHSLRRAYATHLMQNGAQLHEVQKLLGHASAQTTMIYTHVSVDELCQAHRDTHPRARRVTQAAALPKGLAATAATQARASSKLKTNAAPGRAEGGAE